MENWKEVPNYNGVYLISDLGNVKSKNSNKGKLKDFYVELKKSKDFYGYYNVNLCKDKIRTKTKIHQLVALVFLGYEKQKNDGLVIDHINNISTDNRACNLQIITHRENLSKDKKREKSSFVGVDFKKSAKRWRAQIFINGKSKHLGYFNTEIEANNAYNTELKNV